MDENSSKKEESVTFPVHSSDLWQGCMLALCVHGVRLPEYPFIMNEQVWLNGVYLTMDHEGARAALAFSDENIPLVGVFQEFGSMRTELVLSDKYAASFFKPAPEDRKELAKILFPLLEEEIGEEKLPVVTTGFWWEDSQIHSRDSFDDWYENGGHLLERQMMPFEEAMASYEEFYRIDPARLAIIERVYKERVQNASQEVFITGREAEIILKKGPLNKDACQAAFAGFQVYFEV